MGSEMCIRDRMDGHFVPNISYGAPVLKCLHAALPEVYYDVHLMISEPARYAPDFAKAGANLITFHLEAVPDAVGETIDAIRATGCQVGISIRPGTPVEAVYPYLDAVDLVLVMSVEPGFGGQKFIPATVFISVSVIFARSFSTSTSIAPIIPIIALYPPVITIFSILIRLCPIISYRKFDFNRRNK